MIFEYFKTKKGKTEKSNTIIDKQYYIPMRSVDSFFILKEDGKFKSLVIKTLNGTTYSIDNENTADDFLEMYNKWNKIN